MGKFRDLFSLNFVLAVRLTFALTLGLTASAQTPPAPDQGTANFKWIYTRIIQPKCAGCHYDMNSYNRVIESGRIVENFPEKSSFFLSMNSGEMPQGGPHIDNQSLRAVWWWIKAGAKP